MTDKARTPTTTRGSEPTPTEAVVLPECWSVQRKTELVLRLMRGEALDCQRPSNNPHLWSSKVSHPPCLRISAIVITQIGRS
jgi:hypothetical protein